MDDRDTRAVLALAGGVIDPDTREMRGHSVILVAGVHNERGGDAYILSSAEARDLATDLLRAASFVEEAASQ